MLSRFLSLLLLAAIALFSQSAFAVVQESAPAMNCCAALKGHASQDCPNCPASAMGADKCCASAPAAAAVLFLSHSSAFIFAAATDRYAADHFSFPVRSQRPLLPPPKAA